MKIIFSSQGISCNINSTKITFLLLLGWVKSVIITHTLLTIWITWRLQCSFFLPPIFFFFSFPLSFLVCPHLNAYICSDVIHCSLTLLYGGNLCLSLFSLYTDPINIVWWAEKNYSQKDKTRPPTQWHPQPLLPCHHHIMNMRFQTPSTSYTHPNFTTTSIHDIDCHLHSGQQHRRQRHTQAVNIVNKN